MKPKLTWLDDPEVFRVNELPAHSDHRFYLNQHEVKHGQSSFVQKLNGPWRFAYAKDPMSRPQNFYQADYDSRNFDTIEVPGLIEFSGYHKIQYINTFYPWEGQIFRRPPYTMGADQDGQGMFSQGVDNCVGAYVKKFVLNPSLQHKRVRVRFEGVETAMYAWLNGHFLGYAEDSFTPHEFDLTPYLTEGENTLAVEVFNRSTASFLEDQDMFRFFGIFRDVLLVAQPAVHLEDIAIKPTVSDDFKSGHLEVNAQFSGYQPEVTAHLKVTDAEGRLVYETSHLTGEKVQLANTSFSSIHLWDHEDPYLYQLTVTLTNGDGESLEVVPFRFGFRRIEINQAHVMALNGKRLIIKGVNRHEWNAKSGRVITMDDINSDIMTLKRNHINAVRTSHYPNHIDWYYLCDTNGIYMMAETNLESHGSWQKMGKVEPSYNVPGSLSQWKAAVLDRARNNYETFKNHTSILFWSLGNESYAGDDLVAMNDYYKRVDPSRLTHYEGVYQAPAYRSKISDVESRMYEPPKDIEKYLQNNPDKPFMVIEYMHDMGNSLGGMKSYMDLLDKYPMYQGGFIWDLIDQAIEVKDEVTGQKVLRYGGDFDDRVSNYEFSGDGLMFADRTEKPAMQEVRYYYGRY